MADNPRTIPFSQIPRGAVDTDDKIKAALKEGLHEWLDEKFAMLGKWSLGGICAAALGALAYFLINYSK